ncbi:retroviral-like aspartic protease family protein [Candidatus Poribacteria bacterium]|nr:retroviral-like aspartic protease family protein [Candidatus Poribacteria bacterium]
MLTFRYNKGKSPPAPYITLEITPSGRRRKPIRRRAKLDPGASLTVIPESLPKRWRIASVGMATLRAYNGQRSMRPVYVVDIIVGSKRFQEIRVTVAPRRYILLGRDILNQLRITLDGPRQMIEIHQV